MKGPILPGEDIIQIRKWRANLTPNQQNVPKLTTNPTNLKALNHNEIRDKLALEHVNMYKRWPHMMN